MTVFRRDHEPEDQPPVLGPVVNRKPPPPEPQAVHVRDNIWRGPDGKLYTEMPPLPNGSVK